MVEDAGGGRGGDGGAPTELQLFGEPQGQQHHILNIIAARVERTLSISLSLAPSLSLSPKKKHQIYGVKFSRHAIYVRRICSATLSQIVGQKNRHTHTWKNPAESTKKEAKRSENRMRGWLVRGRQSRVWQIEYPVC